ncbi:uncharacterized protein LOC144101960 isoform X2 [Amblyomma americanum]
MAGAARSWHWMPVVVGGQRPPDSSGMHASCGCVPPSRRQPGHQPMLKATKTDKEALRVNKHLKAEVSKLQEKVCSLTNEIAETRDSEALKLERLYREAKEENQFMRRAATAASAGVTPGFNCCSTGKQTCACCTTRCTQVHADTENTSKGFTMQGKASWQ